MKRTINLNKLHAIDSAVKKSDGLMANLGLALRNITSGFTAKRIDVPTEQISARKNKM